MHILAGDIGGTKVDLAVYSSDSGPRQPIAEARFPSADYPSLESIVSEFLTQKELQVDRARFGIAGPVIGGRVKVTNIPWVVDEQVMQDTLHIPKVTLSNDLEVQALAIPHLEPEDIYPLQAGKADPKGPIAIVAPGTGLGEGFLVPVNGEYITFPSEGGHTDFGPATVQQIELLRYLHERLGHVSYERVCSGIGIPNIYAFLKDTGYAEEPDWLAAELAEAEDHTRVISETALSSERTCELCQATINLFVEILGAEAGNFTLKLMATGGVYLGGGIPRHILPALKTDAFLKAFRHKGRFIDILSNVPVNVVLNPKAALLGAACHEFGL